MRLQQLMSNPLWGELPEPSRPLRLMMKPQQQAQFSFHLPFGPFNKKHKCPALHLHKIPIREWVPDFRSKATNILGFRRTSYCTLLPHYTIHSTVNCRAQGHSPQTVHCGPCFSPSYCTICLCTPRRSTKLTTNLERDSLSTVATPKEANPPSRTPARYDPKPKHLR